MTPAKGGANTMKKEGKNKGASPIFSAHLEKLLSNREEIMLEWIERIRCVSDNRVEYYGMITHKATVFDCINYYIANNEDVISEKDALERFITENTAFVSPEQYQTFNRCAYCGEVYVDGDGEKKCQWCGRDKANDIEVAELKRELLSSAKERREP